MIKSSGNKTKVAVFISGRGTNLKSLFYFSKEKNSGVQICIVISNKKNAKGIVKINVENSAGNILLILFK